MTDDTIAFTDDDIVALHAMLRDGDAATVDDERPVVGDGDDA